jgi:hypothetical protein
MACQTSWSKKAWNSPIKSRFPLKKDQKNTQDTLLLTKCNLDTSISSHLCFRTSSQRSSLDFLKPRRKMVQHCSAWWASFSWCWSHQGDQHCGQMMTWQYAPHKENFDECIRDYLEAVVGFPTIGNQLICWLCVAKKPTFMPMQEFMLHQVQLFCYLNGRLLHQTMELPTVQEKTEKSFLCSQRRISLSSRRQTKWSPRTLFGLWPFLSSARLPTKQPVSLISSRSRHSQKRRRGLIFLLLAAMVQTTGIIVARTMTAIEATITIATNANTIVAIKMIDAMPTLVAKRRTSRKRSPTRREIIANVITSKRRKRSCTMTIPPLWVQTLCPEKGVAPCQGLHLAITPVLALAQAAAKGAMQIIIIFLMMTASKAVPSSSSIHIWMMRTRDEFTIKKKTNASLPPSPFQKGKIKIVVPCKEQRQ